MSVEGTMNLFKAQLGEQYRVFIDSGGKVSSQPGMKTMLATIISIKKPEYKTPEFILGWKNNEPHPTGCYERSGNGSHENLYIQDHTEYKWGYKVSPALPVAVQIFNGLDGFPCKKCTNFFPLSEPNQKDGTLVCWSCRNGR